MGRLHVERFLTHLAVDAHVASSTQNQALAALLFLYRDVLEKDFGWLQDVTRAKRPKRLPAVLSVEEVQRVLSQLSGTNRLLANLLYGGGLRLKEALRLRVKDLDLERCEVTVRDGKGQKDRVTIMPRCIIPELKAHLASVRKLHERHLQAGTGGVYLPFALNENIRTPPPNGHGNMCFPLHGLPGILAVAPVDAIMSPNARCKTRSERHCEWQVSSSMPDATRYAIPSPPICSLPAPISAPFKNCSGTKMFAPLKSIPMCLFRTVWLSVVPRIAWEVRACPRNRAVLQFVRTGGPRTGVKLGEADCRNQRDPTMRTDRISHEVALFVQALRVVREIEPCVSSCGRGGPRTGVKTWRS